MDLRIKYFIEKHIDLIDEENWELLYQVLRTSGFNDVAGLFTEAMFDIELDPAAALGYVPEYYMTGGSRITYKIPQGVTSIHISAFHDTTLHEIAIPETVTEILTTAFTYSSNLVSVRIPRNIKKLPDYLFSGCDSLKTLWYAGTIDEWHSIPKDREWKYNSSIDRVACTDGIIEL